VVLRKRGLVILGLAQILACHRERRPPTSAATGPPILIPSGYRIDTLPPRVLADSQLLRQPRYVSASNDLVVVADDGTDSLLNIFEPRSATFIGAVGNRRPSERVFIRTGSVGISKSSLRFVDSYSRRLLEIGIGPDGGRQRMYDIDSGGVEEPFFLDDGRFFALGLRIEGRFGLFTRSGHFMRNIGEAPTVPDTAPIFVRQHVARSVGAINATHDRLALFGHYSDRFEIYDTTGRLRIVGDQPLGYKPEYFVGIRAGAPSVGMVANSRIAYVSATADSNHIFALLSGRSVGSLGGRAFLGDKIVEFDWSGRVQRVLQLTGDMISIAVSPDGSNLFCIQLRPVRALIVYSLRPSREHLRSGAAQ
jgi:hypothetical protein